MYKYGRSDLAGELGNALGRVEPILHSWNFLIAEINKIYEFHRDVENSVLNIDSASKSAIKDMDFIQGQNKTVKIVSPNLYNNNKNFISAEYKIFNRMINKKIFYFLK